MKKKNRYVKEETGAESSFFAFGKILVYGKPTVRNNKTTNMILRSFRK